MTCDQMTKSMAQAVEMLVGSKRTVALTGAGISVESGIPAFRGSQGLWSIYDPEEYASIEGFRADPAKVWKMLYELDAAVQGASPNPAHYALARLEELGRMELVITQNIDGLHQEAGSREVAELHGSGRSLSCLSCSKRISRKDFEPTGQLPARCTCGGVLKPDFVFFGEALPMETFSRAMAATAGCDLMIVIGTSAVVSPASELPRLAVQSGSRVLEVNLEPTILNQTVSDLVLLGPAAQTMQCLADGVAERLQGGR